MTTLPPPDAVRIEELINYFRFDYPQPTDDAPFSVTTELADVPLEPDAPAGADRPAGARVFDEREPTPRNLVFLLDVSGSMMPPDKLPLVRNAMRMLVDILAARSRRHRRLRRRQRTGVAIHARRSARPRSTKRIDATSRRADRPTAATGITLAYRGGAATTSSAAASIVSCSPPTATSTSASRTRTSSCELIEQEREERHFPVRARRRHRQPEGLDDGEAGRQGERKLLLSRFAARGTQGARATKRAARSKTIAKDVKIQVEFNPREVAAYRLIGYENRLLQQRGLQRRPEGCRRDRRRSFGDRALRNRADGVEVDSVRRLIRLKVSTRPAARREPPHPTSC